VLSASHSIQQYPAPAASSTARTVAPHMRTGPIRHGWSPQVALSSRRGARSRRAGLRPPPSSGRRGASEPARGVARRRRRRSWVAEGRHPHRESRCPAVPRFLPGVGPGCVHRISPSFLSPAICVANGQAPSHPYMSAEVVPCRTGGRPGAAPDMVYERQTIGAQLFTTPGQGSRRITYVLRIPNPERAGGPTVSFEHGTTVSLRHNRSGIPPPSGRPGVVSLKSDSYRGGAGAVPTRRNDAA